jgi:hypothetical protein
MLSRDFINEQSSESNSLQENQILQAATEWLPKANSGEGVGETEELLNHTSSHL